MQESTRLNKYISESGLCSRRAADRFIELGQVFINGKRAKVGDKVYFGDVVRVNGQTIEPAQAENTIVLAYNKPVGITSTTELNVKDNIIDHVNHSERVFPVGRLDKDSQGLIFLTNNGDLVNKILRAGNNHEKEYVVTVNKPITPAFLEGMQKGVPVLGVMTKKCKLVQEGPNVFRIFLTQGLNRQIRRMCEYFGFEVQKLERVRIMNIKLKGIPLGEWRELTPEEYAEMLALLAKSKSESPKMQSGSAAAKSNAKAGSKTDNFEKGARVGKQAGFGKRAGAGKEEGKEMGNFGKSTSKSGASGQPKVKTKSWKNYDAKSDWFKNNGPERKSNGTLKGSSSIGKKKRPS
ncbi:MAG: 23S rRNA pseudouridine(2604) synthase RluF [Pedobacter sp.]|nr:MAG: 23S rRNA pseudouridine(2604) synthase RluF [Pedobacter sp.]